MQEREPIWLVGMNVDDVSVRSLQSYSFTDVESPGQSLYPAIIPGSSKTIQVSFGHVTKGAAHVAVMNNSTNSEVSGKTFNVPDSAGTTLYVSISLSAGAYYFYVTPDVCSKTSGSFTVKY